MAVTASAGQAEAKIQSFFQVSQVVVEAQVPGPSSVAFSRPLARSWIEVEQPGLKSAPISDAGTTGGSFTSYTTTPASRILSYYVANLILTR